MPSATTAAVGWSVVLLVAGSFYFISNQRKNKNRRSLPTKGPTKSVESRKVHKIKKTRKEFGYTSAEHEARQAPITQNASNEKKPAPLTRQGNEDDIDNREFARQLLNAKAGTIARPKSLASSRPKSVKQGRAQEKQRTDSSDNTTGNEADDESALNSPISTDQVPQNAARDVSDMLEKTPTQPGVLKITAPLQTTQQEKIKPAKKVEPVGTKKQRQNRQKANEAKLIRAQEEQARKVKMELQRRTAREAEGRAAKDGSAFMASQTQPSSVWTGSTVANNNSVSTNNIQLLDTYEVISSNKESPSEPIESESEEAEVSRQDIPVLSEEEQVRFAIKETETWSIVKGKERRNRANKVNGTDLSNSDIMAVGNVNAASNFNSHVVPSQTYDSSYNVMEEKTKPYEENVSLEGFEWDVS